jgi:hypothetical protein
MYSHPHPPRFVLLLGLLALLVAACGEPGTLTATNLGGPPGDSGVDGADLGADLAQDGGDGDVARDVGPRDAVGDGGDGGAADATDLGEPDQSIEETCETLCFAWDPAEPTSEEPVGDVVFEQCNPLGLSPGVCPDAYTCGEARELPAGTATVTLPVCEPDVATSPQQIDILLPGPPRFLAPVDVLLRPTFNGGTWPASVSGEGAGTIYLTPRTSSGRLEANLPVSLPNEVRFRLDPGVYDVTAVLASGSIDTTRYPSTTRRGRLVVRQPGSTELPFQGTNLTFNFSLDEVTLTPLATGESFTVTFRGAHGQVAQRTFTETESVSGSIVLEPDTYSVEIDVSAPSSAQGLLSGRTTLPTPLVVSGAAQTATLALTTGEVRGTVFVDGLDLPPGEGGVVALIDANGQRAASYSIGTARPAAFVGRAYSGSYNVVYDATGTTLSGVPAMSVTARAGYVVGSPLDLRLQTVEVQGAINLNGLQIPDGVSSRGTMRFNQPGGAGGSLALTATGPATYQGQLFSGIYDVTLTGANGALPAVAWPLESAWVATRDPEAYDIGAHTLTVGLTHRGLQPPDGLGSQRGTLELFNRDNPGGQTLRIARAWPAAGPMAIALFLPDGRWELWHVRNDATYDALPLGRTFLGEVLFSADATQTFDTRGVELVGLLTLGGLAFPPATLGTNRGTVSLRTGLETAGELVISGSGTASFETTVYPGVLDVRYTCSADALCDTAAFGAWSDFVHFGLAVD